jgi:hypothetical protein
LSLLLGVDRAYRFVQRSFHLRVQGTLKGVLKQSGLFIAGHNKKDFRITVVSFPCGMAPGAENFKMASSWDDAAATVRGDDQTIANKRRSQLSNRVCLILFFFTNKNAFALTA